MALNNDAKKILKLIAKHQSHGVVKGDVCPRCGLPNMGTNSVYLKNEKVWVCNNCSLDLSLSSFFGSEDYAKWHFSSFEGGNTAPKKTVKTIILPKFEVGDRVIDDASNWSATIMEPLMDGLYEATYDGDLDIQVLKDKELRYDIETLNIIQKRIQIGDLLKIYKSREIKDSYLPAIGTVVSISPSFCLNVKIGEETEILYPDVDCFSVIRETEIDRFGEIGQLAQDIKIEF